MRVTFRAAIGSLSALWVMATALAFSGGGVPLEAQHKRWGADYFPNVTLTNQDGRQVKFYDDLIKGKIVAVNLIYTTCQYACPLETARLAQVQKLLGDRMGRDIHFYSITIDPERDTPAVLKDYAAKYRVGPGWQFLTGSAADIELISKKIGLYSRPDPNDKDGHTPNLLVGNEVTGQWMRNSAVDNPRFLARTIGDWLNSWQTAQKTELKSYADAPKINMDRGHYTFKMHCAACHTVGKGDQIGPDLVGVTRTRDRAWLSRFIVEPDKMFAEKDPLALALKAKYKDVLMPNLGLGAADAAEILSYLESESPAPATPAAPAPAPKLESASIDIAGVVSAYLWIQQALSDDRLAPSEHARAVSLAVARLGAAGAPMQAAADRLATAGDVAGARSAFGQLGDAILILAKARNARLDPGVSVAYCPMARKYWLQTGTTVRNPFYGQSMLECGRITAEIPDLTR